MSTTQTPARFATLPDEHALAATVTALGCDPVRLDSLRAGRALQPGGPAFGSLLTRAEFERAASEDARSLR